MPNFISRYLHVSRTIEGPRWAIWTEYDNREGTLLMELGHVEVVLSWPRRGDARA